MAGETTPLAQPADVRLLFPFDDSQQNRVSGLIASASALLRQRVPWIDDRIARYETDPTDTGALSPDVVSSVVASIVKRFLTNEEGATNTTKSETIGPYSTSETTGWALRGDTSVRGELVVTDSDIAKLMPPKKSQARIGSFRARPRMAPWPIGDMGSPSAAGVPGSSDLWVLGQADDPALSTEYGPFGGHDPNS